MTSNNLLVAKDIMHPGCTCISHSASVFEAAQRMADEGFGAFPVCGPEDRLLGMLTDRDIVVHCIAKGLDPHSCTAADVVQGPLIWTSDNTPIGMVIARMEEHKIRRIPVIDMNKRVCGMVSMADIAERVGEIAAGELVAEVSRGPAVQHAV